MTNYNDRDDDGDDDKKEDGKDNGNADYGSGSYGPIFHFIKIPWSRGGGSVPDGHSTAATAHYISTLLKMCHKPLYV